MDQTYHPHPECTLRIFDMDDRWYVALECIQNIRCDAGNHHRVEIERTREITSREDRATMNAYDGALRGSTTAATNLVSLLIDEHFNQVWLDPCLIPI